MPYHLRSKPSLRVVLKSRRLSGIKDTPRDFHYFSKLPKEVKQEVYKLLLVVGKFYVPGVRWDPRPMRHHGSAEIRRLYIRDDKVYRANDQRYGSMEFECLHDMVFHPANRYTPGLIQAVSEEVQEEAEAIFFGYNQFVFPAGRMYEPNAFGLFTLLHNDRDRFIHLVKDLSLAFDMRDEGIDGVRHRERMTIDIETRSIEPNIRKKCLASSRGMRKELHSRRKICNMDQWRTRILCLRKLTQLHRLQIDFHNCYCPLGCCPLTEFVCKHLGQKWEKAAPEVVEIMGWKGPEERISTITHLVKAGIKARNIKFIPFNPIEKELTIKEEGTSEVAHMTKEDEDD
ncbi:hypothetical protein F5Y04DRAFT_291830 [Hypomontagnella monticulosa]|nr:hypothetical protein F5Y04DRAFT_291830 [Hypomontagnella monticulosa]